LITLKFVLKGECILLLISWAGKALETVHSCAFLNQLEHVDS
jgi:hypothetical protein